MDNKHKGARSELIAITWLLSSGYEVFRNISQHGLADIVVWKDGKIIFLDVKSSSCGKEGSPYVGTRLSEDQIKNGILPIYVRADDTCEIDFNPVPRLSEKICFVCSSLFRSKKLAQKYCSEGCRSVIRSKAKRAKTAKNRL